MSDIIQQQLIAARKKQILEAAAAVFAQKGFHQATTRDIAKQAGISEGTIYNYFNNKTALLLGIFDQMRTSIMEQAIPPTADDHDVRMFLRGFLRHPLMGLRQDNFALFRIVVSEMMVNEELRTLYYQNILEPTLAVAEAYFQERALVRGQNPKTVGLTVRAISGMIMGLIVEHIMGDAMLAEEWESLPDFLADLLLHGLSDRSA